MSNIVAKTNKEAFYCTHEFWGLGRKWVGKSFAPHGISWVILNRQMGWLGGSQKALLHLQWLEDDRRAKLTWDYWPRYHVLSLHHDSCRVVGISYMAIGLQQCQYPNRNRKTCLPFYDLSLEVRERHSHHTVLMKTLMGSSPPLYPLIPGKGHKTHPLDGSIKESSDFFNCHTTWSWYNFTLLLDSFWLYIIKYFCVSVAL